MSEHPMHDEPFPRLPLLAAGAVLFTTLVLVAMARVTDVGAGRGGSLALLESQPLAARADLHFSDGDNGTVIVTEAGNDRTVAVLDYGTHGFVRSVMRGLTHERGRRGIGSEPPFVLARTNSGILYLVDPALDRRIELNAFGPSNVGAFDDILTAAAIDLPLQQAAALAEHQGEEQ